MAKRIASKRAPRVKKPKGRPPQFFADPKKAEAFINWMLSGCSRNDACKRVGCARMTIDNAMDRDPELRRRVEEAETSSKVLAIGCVTTHSQTNPVIALQYLARKWPNEWAYRKPDVITRVQFKAMIEQLTATLINELPAEHHGRLYAIVGALLMGVVTGEATMQPEGEKDAET